VAGVGEASGLAWRWVCWRQPTCIILRLTIHIIRTTTTPIIIIHTIRITIITRIIMDRIIIGPTTTTAIIIIIIHTRSAIPANRAAFGPAAQSVGPTWREPDPTAEWLAAGATWGAERPTEDSCCRFDLCQSEGLVGADAWRQR